MNKDLPRALKWRDFVAALKELKIKPLESKSGSARSFLRPDGEVVTFHQPHGNDTIRPGTLRNNYFNQLGVSKEKFLAALNKVPAQSPNNKGEDVAPEDRYRRVTRLDGTVVSVCGSCFETVASSKDKDEIEAAECVHGCWIDRNPGAIPPLIL